MWRRQALCRLAVLALVVGLVLATTSAASATEQSSATPVNHSVTERDPTRIAQCTTINESGFYRLSQNVTADATDTCLLISADDVFLDGAGHHIRNGESRTDGGIVVREASNVTVRDVHVRGMTWGVVFRDGRNGRLERVRTNENVRAGVWILESRNVTVKNLTALRNPFDGLRIHSSRGGQVIDSRFSNNGVGVSVGRSTDVTIRDNTITDNQLGAQVMTTRNSRIATNRMTGNRIGVVLALSDRNVLKGNLIRRGEDGLRLDSADDNTVRKNVVRNVSFGIFLFESAGNALHDNQVRTKSVGIEFAFDSNDNCASGNSVRSDGVGLELTSSEGNTLWNNRIGATEGIKIARGEDNTVVGNQITRVDTPEVLRTTGDVSADESAETPSETSRSTPGFGTLAVVIALLASALLARRVLSY